MNCEKCGGLLEVLLVNKALQPLVTRCLGCEGQEKLSTPEEPIGEEREVPEYSSWCEGILRQKSGWSVLPPTMKDYLEYEETARNFSPDRLEMEALEPMTEDCVTFGLMLVWIAQTLGQSKRKAMGTSLRHPPVLSEDNCWIFPGGSLVSAAQRVAMEVTIGDRWPQEEKDIISSRLKNLTSGMGIEEVAKRLRWAQRWTVWYQMNFHEAIEESMAKGDRLSDTQDLILQKVTELLMSPTAKRIVSGEDGSQITVLPHKDWSPKLVPELLKTHTHLQQLGEQQRQRETSIEEAVLTLCDMGIYGAETRSSVQASIASMRDQLREIVSSRGGLGAEEAAIEVESEIIL